MVETLDISNFEHLLSDHLKDASHEHTNPKDKIRAVLQKLDRFPEDHHENFVNMLAGLYPGVYNKLVGKLPEDHETGKKSSGNTKGVLWL